MKFWQHQQKGLCSFFLPSFGNYFSLIQVSSHFSFFSHFFTPRLAITFLSFKYLLTSVSSHIFSLLVWQSLFSHSSIFSLQFLLTFFHSSFGNHFSLIQVSSHFSFFSHFFTPRLAITFLSFKYLLTSVSSDFNLSTS